MEEVCQQIFIHEIIDDGLTDWFAFVVKCKKFKIVQIVMNALLFSAMHTIIDAFWASEAKQS